MFLVFYLFKKCIILHLWGDRIAGGQDTKKSEKSTMQT